VAVYWITCTGGYPVIFSSQIAELKFSR